MKKKLSKIFLLILFSLLFCFVSSSRISADAGFDSDYDSDYDSGYDNDYNGGWGGGSSSSGNRNDNNSNNTNYSGGNISGEVWLITIGAIVVMAGIPLSITLISAHYSGGRSRRRVEKSPINTSGYKVDDDLNCEVFDMYMDINIAWMNKDLEPVRHLMTDELYNMYLMQLDTLIEANQTNIMKNFNLVSGHIVSKRKYNGVETIKMIFRVKCKDYIIDGNGRVISGDENVTWDYTYEMKLVRNVMNAPLECPSCGETLSKKDGVICPVCETVLHSYVSSLRLADKNMLRQVKVRR